MSSFILAISTFNETATTRAFLFFQEQGRHLPVGGKAHDLLFLIMNALVVATVSLKMPIARRNEDV